MILLEANNFENFLRDIYPNITVLAVLFAISIAFLQLFWMFNKYEDKLRDDHFKKVEDINAKFSEKVIEPKLISWISENTTVGYKMAITTLLNAIYPEQFDAAKGTNVRVLKEKEEIEKTISSSELTKTFEEAQKIIKKKSAEDISSAEGQKFLNSLVTAYNEKRKLSSAYSRMKIFCRGVWLSCLTLAIFSIVGMFVKTREPSLFTVHFWLFSFSLLFILGVTFAILLFDCKNKLVDEWEKQQLYNNEKSE